MKRLFIVISILIIPLLVGIVTYIRFTQNEDKSSEVIQNDSIEILCLDLLGEVVVGKWMHGPSDYLVDVVLTLSNDKKFLYDVIEREGDRNYQLSGYWMLNEETYTLTLVFDSVNDVWKSILEDPDLKKNFPSVVSYNTEDRSIEVELGYTNQVEGEVCDVSNYYINILNVLLYKQ